VRALCKPDARDPNAVAGGHAQVALGGSGLRAWLRCLLAGIRDAGR
jgi:hypothetical protein